jgi:hypothetical protein
MCAVVVYAIFLWKITNLGCLGDVFITGDLLITLLPNLLP